MFEDLKREQAAGLGSKERARLTIFVGACLMMGVALIGLQSCPDTSGPVEDDTPEVTNGNSEAVAPVQIDAGKLAELGSRPAGNGARAELLDSYSAEIVQYMRSTVEGEPAPGESVTPKTLATRKRADALGSVFDVEGRVVARVEQVFPTETQRLWSLVLQDDSGAQVVVVKHGLRSDALSGAPRDDSMATDRRPVYVGQYLRARGYYVQRRTGTIGDTVLPTPAPVLWGTNFRQVLEPADRQAPVAKLADIEWAAVRDRFFAETRALDEPQLFQTIQWARAQGTDRIREMIEKGEIEIPEWEQDTFSKWQAEVDVRDGSDRTFTNGARGKIFKTSGLIANQSYEGWNSVRANPYSVDDLTVLDIHSDHYGNQNIRTISAFEPSRFPGVKGEFKEHVWIYGVFFKNHTFYTKKSRPGEQGPSPITMPSFVVVHMEPMRYDVDDESYQSTMWIIAGIIVLLGFIFWLVFVRGESREAKRTEAHRIRLRQRMRAKGHVPTPTKDAGEAPAADDGADGEG